MPVGTGVALGWSAEGGMTDGGSCLEAAPEVNGRWRKPFVSWPVAESMANRLDLRADFISSGTVCLWPSRAGAHVAPVNRLTLTDVSGF